MVSLPKGCVHHLQNIITFAVFKFHHEWYFVSLQKRIWHLQRKFSDYAFSNNKLRFLVKLNIICAQLESIT